MNDRAPSLVEQLVTVDDIRAAAARIAPFLLPTPLIENRWLSHRSSSDVFVKWESQQLTGSFKLRGALNKLLKLKEQGVTEVLAVSAGNHGLGVAHAANLLGMRATIVVPESAVATKVAAIASYGVALRQIGADYDAAEIAARRLAEAGRTPFVSPYNDPDVIAGQGTIALEMLAVRPFDLLFVPAGGGGLLAGMLVAARALRPTLRVYGVQPKNANALGAAFARGHIVPVEEQPTIADGLSGNLEAGSITVPLLFGGCLDRILTVSEEGIEHAIEGFVEHDHQIVEGSAAVAAAALLEFREFQGLSIGVVITGRNIDATRLAGILSRRIAI